MDLSKDNLNELISKLRKAEGLTKFNENELFTAQNSFDASKKLVHDIEIEIAKVIESELSGVATAIRDPNHV
jgi:hypothetical protein